MPVIASVVDLDALWKILLAGLAAGAGVVVAFGFVLLGHARYTEARQGTAARTGYLLMAGLGAAFCATALILGLIAMTHK